MNPAPLVIRLLLALLVLALAARASAQQEVHFFAPRAFAIGGVPADMKLVYLNDDNFVDIVATNFGEGTISVLLGAEGGEFVALDDFPVVTSPTQIASGDFNNDTKTDLAISETESDTVTTVLGNGDGTFKDPVHQPCGHDSQGVTTAFMDTDDKLDLVVSLSAEGGGHVDVLRGNGDGTFIYNADGGRNLSGGSFGVDVADIDGDHNLDAVATTGDGKVFVLAGDGMGELGRAQPFATGAAPFGIAVGDFDGNMLPDVVTADSGDSAVGLLRNDGAGGFSAPASFPVGFGPAKVVAAYVNDDDKLDVLTADTGGGDVSLLLGDGAGGFAPARLFAAPPRTFAAAAMDVTGDGVVDLLAAVDSQILVMAGRPGGYEAVESALSGLPITDAREGDINGDGLSDIVASSRRAGAGVVALLSLPSGGFGQPTTIAETADAGYFTLADVNADNRPDVVALSRNNPDALVILSQLDGSFAAPRSFELAGPGSSVIVDDFDADGRADIAAVTQIPPAVSILFGNGDGTFQPRSVVTLSGTPARLTSGEFDGTTGADLAVANLARNEIALLFGRTDRSFDQSHTIATTVPTLSIYSADFDGDGADDVAASAARSTVWVFYGDGAGTFTSGPGQSLATVPITLAARDVTGDGRPDLLVADQAGSQVGVAPYTGDRAFGSLVRFTVGQNPVALTSGDFNGDGAYDLLGAGVGTSIMTNATTGARRSDGNGDGIVSAADVTVAARALAAHPHARVEDVGRDTPGVTSGVDANGDGAVDAADLHVSVGRLFAGA